MNFGESRSSKTAAFAILGALNFVNLVNFSLQKWKKTWNAKFRGPKFVKMIDYALLESPDFT